MQYYTIPCNTLQNDKVSTVFVCQTPFLDLCYNSSIERLREYTSTACQLSLRPLHFIYIDMRKGSFVFIVIKVFGYKYNDEEEEDMASP